MIKIESADSSSTITRDGEQCVLFPGMIITAEEVLTIVANGDVVYSIDESLIVTVAKGTKATINALPQATAEEAPATVEAPAPAPVEAAQAEVVPQAVEASSQAPAKK